MKKEQSEHLEIKPKNWFSRHKKPLIIATASLIVFAIIATITFFMLPKNTDNDSSSDNNPDTTTPEPEPTPIFYSRLSGLEVASQAAETAAATCVMVENSPDARPQSGLSQAGIIYEAIAEGGITRFLAIFQDQKPDLIGPVRSVRKYYVDWLTPYNCSVAHVGGADDALAMLRNSSNGYRDIDQFFNASSYWRSKDRYAPHNVYTNFERLDALNSSRGYTESVFDGFPRLATDEVKISQTPATNIKINISSSLYNSIYAYDATTNSYLRAHQSGGAHMDKNASGTSTQNSPKVVIAMMVSQSIASDGSHQNISTVDTGTAYIFQNGKAITGKWSKSARNAEIKFTDSEGKTISFTPGQIWITAIPKNKSVTWE